MTYLFEKEERGVRPSNDRVKCLDAQVILMDIRAEKRKATFSIKVFLSALHPLITKAKGIIF